MKKLCLIIGIGMLLYACGCGSGETKIVKVPADENPSTTPPPAPPPTTGKTSFTRARTIIGQYCEACHANSPWLQDENSLRASSVLARTQNNSMPPNSSSITMGSGVRQELINFF